MWVSRESYLFKVTSFSNISPGIDKVAVVFIVVPASVYLWHHRSVTRPNLKMSPEPKIPTSSKGQIGQSSALYPKRLWIDREKPS